MNRIAHFLNQRYQGEGLARAHGNEILRVCTAFIDSGLADPKFSTELTSGSDTKFWSRVSEALVFDRLKPRLFPDRKSVGVGPDFSLRDGARRVWIEVICPEPSGIPNDWLEVSGNTVGRVPHDAIVLRWTSAIKAKAELLIGSSDRKSSGYLQKGLVSGEDIYVIAVNGCRLRHGPFSALHGVSRFPYALEAVFPIGPLQVRMDRDTHQILGSTYQERYHIPKPNGALIPSFAFLDRRYEMISAIWALDFNGSGVTGSKEPCALIHNPLAINPLAKHWLPADEEYAARQTEDDEFVLERIDLPSSSSGEGDG